VMYSGKLTPLLQRWYRPMLYVCPRSGILKKVKQVGRNRRKHSGVALERRVPIDPNNSFVRRQGVWHRREFTTFPTTWTTHQYPFPSTVHDALERCKVTRDDAIGLHGRPVVAKKVRVATRHEIREYCEPLKAPNIVR